MKPTTLLLHLKYDGATIPIEQVRSDFFSHLSRRVFLRQLASGSIDIPIVRLGRGRKAAGVVHVDDLASYVDRQRDAASKELTALVGENRHG